MSCVTQCRTTPGPCVSYVIIIRARSITTDEFCTPHDIRVVGVFKFVAQDDKTARLEPTEFEFDVDLFLRSHDSN